VAIGLALAMIVALIVPAAAAPSQGAGQDDWDAIVAAARAEGTLSITVPRGLEYVRTMVTEPFERQYGIHVDYYLGGPPDVVAQVRERGDNVAPWDVFVGGNDTLMFNLKALGALQPIEPALLRPDVRDLSNWDGGRYPFADRDGYVFAFLREGGEYFYVNTARADPATITSYRDLLKPEWKGQIVATGDPREGGSVRTIFAFLYTHPDLGPDFVRELLTNQDVRFSESDADDEEIVTHGDFGICLCDHAQGVAMRENGIPVQLLDPHGVREGISVTSSFANVTLAKRAAHPNAAKVYLNWLLSHDAGQLFTDMSDIPSTRADVDKSSVDPRNVPDPSWVIGNNEDAMSRALEMVRFITPLMPARP
jgi:iron(III) transport system substrate-binding protein